MTILAHRRPPWSTLRRSRSRPDLLVRMLPGMGGKAKGWARAAISLMRQVVPVIRHGGALVGAAATVLGGSVLGAVGWLITGSSHRTVIHQKHGVTTIMVVTASRWPWAIALASAGMFVIVLLAGIRAQKELNGRIEDKPVLIMETGNGPPWDHQDYAIPPPEMIESLAKMSASMGKSPPVVTGGKRFKFSNDGAKAEGCRATLVIPVHGSSLPLDWEPRGFSAVQVRDLAHGEESFAALQQSRLPALGTMDAELRVFAENLDHPVVRKLRIKVEDGGFPQITEMDG